MAHLLGAVRHQMGPLLSLIFSRGGPSREGPSALGLPSNHANTILRTE